MKTIPATATPRPTVKGTSKIKSIALQKSHVVPKQRIVRAYPAITVSPRPSMTSSDAAVVTFTVTNFVPLNTTKLGLPKTEYYVTLADGTNRVTLDTSVSPSGLEVNNHGGSVLFQFIVKAASGPDHYVPIGISFDLSSGSASTGAPADYNFPSTMFIHNGEILTFTDTYLQYLDQYDFTVIIKNQTTHQLGILDPCIIHEN